MTTCHPTFLPHSNIKNAQVSHHTGASNRPPPPRSISHYVVLDIAFQTVPAVCDTYLSQYYDVIFA